MAMRQAWALLGKVRMILLFLWATFAAVGYAIGHGKGRPGLGLALGFLLGVFGWIIVAVLPTVGPKCPSCFGNVDPRASVCPHCRSFWPTDAGQGAALIARQTAQAQPPPLPPSPPVPEDPARPYGHLTLS